MTGLPKIEDLQSRLAEARDIAKRAGETALGSYLDPTLKVEMKLDKTIVTATDREIEAQLRASIAKRFPEDAIIGEEGVDVAGDSGFRWILDPIDGTQSFASGNPLFGTLIGITYRDEPVIGVCEMPAVSETFYALKGSGAWWRGAGMKEFVRATCSTRVTSLKESFFITTSHSGFRRAGRRDLFNRLLDETKKFRGWGSCYGHMMVASGRADLVVEPDLKVWDCAALYPIVTEAGGRFFDLEGRPRVDGGSGISCAAGLEGPVRKFLGLT